MSILWKFCNSFLLFLLISQLSAILYAFESFSNEAHVAQLGRHGSEDFLARMRGKSQAASGSGSSNMEDLPESQGEPSYIPKKTSEHSLRPQVGNLGKEGQIDFHLNKQPHQPRELWTVTQPTSSEQLDHVVNQNEEMVRQLQMLAADPQTPWAEVEKLAGRQHQYLPKAQQDARYLIDNHEEYQKALSSLIRKTNLPPGVVHSGHEDSSGHESSALENAETSLDAHRPVYGLRDLIAKKDLDLSLKIQNRAMFEHSLLTFDLDIPQETAIYFMGTEGSKALGLAEKVDHHSATRLSAENHEDEVYPAGGRRSHRLVESVVESYKETEPGATHGQDKGKKSPSTSKKAMKKSRKNPKNRGDD